MNIRDLLKDELLNMGQGGATAPKPIQGKATMRVSLADDPGLNTPQSPPQIDTDKLKPPFEPEIDPSAGMEVANMAGAFQQPQADQGRFPYPDIQDSYTRVPTEIDLTPFPFMERYLMSRQARFGG